MRQLRWVFLITMLVVILSSIGCGTRTTSDANTQLTNTEQIQNTKDTPSENKDSEQTQNTKDTPSENKDSEQTQNTKDTQSENKDTAQTQSNVSTQTASKDDSQTLSNATQSPTKNTTPTPPTPPTPTPTENKASTPVVKSNPIVTITMASEEQIKMELYPNVAPNTVKSFISLTQKGFYNGLIFHRVIPGFMIQGGDPNGIGTGGPGYSIKGEFINNGFNNNLKHERGVLSMGRTPDPNSAGSQFFIMVGTVQSLDKEYAAFGKVISGMDAVDKIVSSSRDQKDKPLHNQVMKSVTVDTFGVNYGEPEVIKK